MSGIMFTPVASGVEDGICGRSSTEMEDFKPEYVENYAVIFSNTDKYYCVKCKDIVRSPVKQLYCGHSMCGSCLADLQRSGEKDGIRCPGNEDICSETDLLKIGHVVPAFHVEKQLKKMYVRRMYDLDGGSSKHGTKCTSVLEEKAVKNVGSQTISSESFENLTFASKQSWRRNSLSICVCLFVMFLLCTNLMFLYLQTANHAQFHRKSKSAPIPDTIQLHRYCDQSDDTLTNVTIFDLRYIVDRIRYAINPTRDPVSNDPRETTNVDSETSDDTLTNVTIFDLRYIADRIRYAINPTRDPVSNNPREATNVDSETSNDSEYVNQTTYENHHLNRSKNPTIRTEELYYIGKLNAIIEIKTEDGSYQVHSQLVSKRDTNLSNLSDVKSNDGDRTVTKRMSEITVIVIMVDLPVEQTKSKFCAVENISKNTKETLQQSYNERVNLFRGCDGAKLPISI